MKKTTLDNRQITIRDVADDVGNIVLLIPAIFYGCFRPKICGCDIVPNLLNFKQKQRPLDIAKEILMTFESNSDLLKKVITGDES